jgi:hypothetical protein
MIDITAEVFLKCARCGEESTVSDPASFGKETGWILQVLDGVRRYKHVNTIGLEWQGTGIPYDQGEIRGCTSCPAMEIVIQIFFAQDVSARMGIVAGTHVEDKFVSRGKFETPKEFLAEYEKGAPETEFFPEKSPLGKSQDDAQ